MTSFMREKISGALQRALEDDDRRAACTMRLIVAALKDRDNEHRSHGKDKVSDEDIIDILSHMVRQRESSVRVYHEEGQVELAEQEREEMDIIRALLPRPLDEGEMKDACIEAIREAGASGLRDLGKAMNALKARYPGRIDHTRATGVVRDLLADPSR